MIETAKAILERGDAVLMFPEGTRTRPGALGKPKRGVGRLALETGATVVPVAMIGTEAIRKGWRIRPHKIRVRIGAPLTFPKVENATAPLAAAVTDRIWPNVMLQWEWLGGLPPLRRAAVIGSGAWSTSLSVGLARAGIDVDLGTSAPAEDGLPPRVRAVDISELEFRRYDLVVFAVPASELPAAVAEYGPRIQHRTGVLVRSTGLVPPLGTLPSGYVAERIDAWAVGALGGPTDILEAEATVVVASSDAAFARQVQMALRAAKLKDPHRRCAAPSWRAAPTPPRRWRRRPRPRRARTPRARRPARCSPSSTRSRAGPAPPGRRLGSTDELVVKRGRQGRPFRPGRGAAAGSRRRIPLLAARLHEAGVDAPVLEGLVGIIEGRVEPGDWTSSLDAEPPAFKRAV